MLILVLEASTASAKAMLYDSALGVVGILPRQYSNGAGDTRIYDVDLMMRETLAVGKELLAQHDIHTVDMVATCSIWSHSLVLLDGSKRPVSRLSTWADTTASSTAEKYRRDHTLFQALYRRTGCPIHSTYTLWKYIHERDAGNAAAAVYIASLPDYLFLTLTDVFAVSPSTASAGGFLNLHSRDWDEEALRLGNAHRGMLPQLVPSEFTAPLTPAGAVALGLRAGTPVLVTQADGCMHQVAAGGFGDHIVTLSVGTSGALRMATDAPVLAAYPSTWCYVGVEDMWVAGSAIAGAGNCVDWIGKKALGANGHICLAELERGATLSLARGNAPIFLPFLVGERCPGWDDTRKASFHEVDIDHDAYDLYYAVLEGVLFNLKQCYDIMLPIIGESPSYISISGGIESSPLWMDMTASVFGLPVHTLGLPHASLLGTAIMARKAAGEIASVKTVKPQTTVSCVPDPRKGQVLSGRFSRYMQCYGNPPSHWER